MTGVFAQHARIADIDGHIQTCNHWNKLAVQVGLSRWSLSFDAWWYVPHVDLLLHIERLIGRKYVDKILKKPMTINQPPPAT